MDIDFRIVKETILNSVIHFSVDRVNASIFLPKQTEILELFEGLLQIGFTSENERRPNKGNYNRFRVFKKNNYELKVFFNRKGPIPIYPDAHIVLLQPCAEIFNEIRSILLAVNGLKYNLNRVELAIDFYPFSYILKEFFDYFLVLKWSRAKLSNWREGCDFSTSYFGKLGQHTICTTYWDIDEQLVEELDGDGDDDGNDKSYLRTEIRFFTPTIKARSFDLLPNAYTNVDLSRFISFRYFDRASAIKTVQNYLKRNDFNDRDISFLKRILLPPIISKLPIMDVKYHIRNSNVRFANIYRHIKPIPELEFLISQLSSVNFLPDGDDNRI